MTDAGTTVLAGALLTALCHGGKFYCGYSKKSLLNSKAVDINLGKSYIGVSELITIRKAILRELYIRLPEHKFLKN